MKNLPLPPSRIFTLLFGLLFLIISSAFGQKTEPTPKERYISSLLADIEQNNRIVGEITEESLNVRYPN